MAQINLGGSIGVPGSTAVLGNYNIIFASDADHTMTVTEFSNKFLNVTSSLSLTATHNLIAPLNQGQEYVVQNNTTGGQSIVIKGSTGTGVTVPHAGTLSVVCDGTNYMQTSGSGTFTAGGDLSGTSSSQTVIALQGHPVSATSPTSGQVLEFTGGAWTPVTFSPAGVSWTGDLGAGAGTTPSSDSVQYVTSISGAQGGGTPGRIQLYGNEFRILNSVTSDFNFDWMPMTSSTGVGAAGHKIILTAQNGQVGGSGFASGIGGDIKLQAGSGVSGGGSTASNGGDIQIFSGPGAGGAPAGGLIFETGDSQQFISIDNTSGPGSNGITIESIDNLIISNSQTGPVALLVIANSWDGYTSALQMSANTVFLNCGVQHGYYPYTQLQTNGVIQFQVSGPPFPTGSFPTDPFITVVTGQTQVASSTFTIRTLNGSGTGLVGVDNNGTVSFTPYSAVTPVWSNDLSGNSTTTNTNQYVSSLSYSSSSSGGPIAINGTGTSLQWANNNTGPVITQASPASAAVAFGAAGADLLIQPQPGQPVTGAGNQGGTGGNLRLTSGLGGTSSGGPVGGAGEIIISDGVDSIMVEPGPGIIVLTAFNDVLLQAGTSQIDLTQKQARFNSGMRFAGVNVTSSTYTCDSGTLGDYYLMCSTGSTAVAITLPSPQTGRTIVVKDISGNAATNNITVTAPAGVHIDSGTSYVINTNWASITFVALTVGEGVQHWYVVSEYNGTVI